jgi:serine/threonine protein phosphatase PrpC
MLPVLFLSLHSQCGQHSPCSVQASDVYALAVTLNEAATGTIPFSDCCKDNPACHTVLDASYGHQELATAVAAEQLRPCLPGCCPPSWALLMERCWCITPAERPDCAQLLDGLLRFAQAEGLEESNGPLAVAAAMERRAGADAASAVPENGTVTSLEACVGGTEGRGEVAPLWQAEAQVRATVQLAMVAGAYADAGGRNEMEDRHILACPLAGCWGASLLAVCDGHRGAQAADYVALHLPGLVRSCWHRQDVDEPQAVLAHALNLCEQGFAAQEERNWAERQNRMGAAAHGSRRWPGTAVVAVLQVGDLLAWAHLGDCRAILCRDGIVLQLTRDHIVSDALEHARIKGVGSTVSTAPDGSLRIGCAHLQVSRSIGDLDAKGSGPEGGVSAVPDTGTLVASEGDAFLVLASDGLWDVVSNIEAIALVHDTVKNPSMAAKRLVMEALARGASDNVTVVTCFLRDCATLERVYKDGVQKYAPAVTCYGSRAAMLAQFATGRSADEVTEQL